MKHLTDTQVTGADGRVHVLGILVVDRLGQLGQIETLDIQAAHFTVKQYAPLVQVLIPRLMFKPRLDFGPSPGSAHIAQAGV